MKKVLLYIANRLWLIVLIYIVSILTSSWLFSHFENKPYSDGLWWSCVTALTIGYGDLSPTTTGGRITAFVFAHFWILGIISLIVANIVTRVMKDENKFTHLEQEWQEEAMKLIAEKLGVVLPPSPKDH